MNMIKTYRLRSWWFLDAQEFEDYGDEFVLIGSDEDIDGIEPHEDGGQCDESSVAEVMIDKIDKGQQEHEPIFAKNYFRDAGCGGYSNVHDDD